MWLKRPISKDATAAMQLTDESTIANCTRSRPSCHRCQCVRMTDRNTITTITDTTRNTVVSCGNGLSPHSQSGFTVTTVTSASVGTTPNPSAATGWCATQLLG